MPRGQFNRLRNRIDYFRYYSNANFFLRFRLTKLKARILIEHLRPHLRPKKIPGRCLSVENQILISLRYYATGSFQRVCADLNHVSQSTVSRVVKRVSNIIVSLKSKLIKFPTPQERAQIKQGFQQIQGFPHVIGCIDGTHIPIKKPRQNAANFMNRKGYYSVNTQIVCDDKLRIRNIVCRWVGSTHDSRIFENSTLSTAFENRDLGGILLGDNGYACKDYLLTPLLQPSTNQQIRYNESHKSTRNTVERCIGLLKSKFRCLSQDSKMRLKLDTALIVTVVCAILHNLSLSNEQDIRQKLMDNNNNNYIAGRPIRNHERGTRFRAQFLQQNF